MLVAARVRAQLGYRRSFTADLLGQLLFVGLDLVELVGVLGRAPSVGGLGFRELFLVFALAQLAFALGALVLGQLDEVSDRVRAGTVDVVLVRPMSALVQIATDDIALRRVGRLVVAAVVLPVALAGSGIEWTAARVALAAATPLCGAAVFASLFVVAGAISFFLLDGREFGNAFTYGGNYLAQWPVGLLPTALSRLFTFVLPAAFVAYLPALALLGRTGLAPVPAWLCWCPPLGTAVAALLAVLAWRAALRRYTGGGG